MKVEDFVVRTERIFEKKREKGRRLYVCVCVSNGIGQNKKGQGPDWALRFRTKENQLKQTQILIGSKFVGDMAVGQFL